jgi:DNA-nicking Smr family endonuclease
VGRSRDDSELALPTRIPIEEVLDLHTFAPRDVLAVVEAYLEAAVEQGLREVRIVHGKGRGVQRARVRELLSGHPAVERFCESTPERGGWGATLAWLRAPDPREP